MPGRIQRDAAEFVRIQQVSEMAENPSENAPLNPNALDAAALALVLTRAGGGRWRGTQEEIRADLNAGAPTNPDGSLSLIAYCAWLIRERGRAG